MGQPITVTARAGVRPDVMHFELNRSLTGMQTERYASVDDATLHRPPDELARRLFPLGVTNVTIYSSTVTVTAPAERWGELEPKVRDVIENLFIFYRTGGPGVSPEAEGAAPPPPPSLPAQPAAEEPAPAS